MINIHNFDKALKTSWIKRLITQPNSQWYRLMYENFSQFLHFGDQWCSKIFPNVHNQFWQDVLKDWQTLVKIQQPQND